MNNTYNILLFQIEMTLCNQITSEFKNISYKVDIANNEKQLLSLIENNIYALVIIDISTSNKKGLEFCKYCRDINNNIAIILLSPISAIENKLLAFIEGADEYLTKPFDGRELIAKIKINIKRTLNSSSKKNNIIIVGNIEINRNAKTVFKDGQEIKLSKKGFEMLHLFAINRGIVLSKQEILAKIWYLNFDPNTNLVEVAINSLRKNIGENIVYTKIGFGYYIN